MELRGLLGTLMLAMVVWSCSGSSADSDVVPKDRVVSADAPLELPGEPSPEAVTVVPYPNDSLLNLNHLQCKGTHNSYHLVPDELVSPEWNYEHAPLDVQLAQFGVRQVELDIHWHEEEGQFAVYHVPVLDDKTSCEELTECLQLMKNWSEANPGHQALFIFIEPKDDIDVHTIEGHYEQLDEALLAVWPRERVVTPADVVGDYTDMREALAEAGWPTLGETRGKALFHLLDSGHHRANYLGPDITLQERVMHVRGGPETPWGSFVEVGNAHGGEEQIVTYGEAGYIVRSTADSTDPADFDSNPARAAAALVASHVISTDFPAATEDGSYYFKIPEGTPSRCHPVTAPDWCTAVDIEALP